MNVRKSNTILILIISLIDVLFSREDQPFSTTIPTFYVDPNALNIFQSRAKHCLANGDALSELEVLAKTDSDSYIRSQELYAYHYFVEIGDKNPNRRFDRSEAEFEYVPLLPLHWRAIVDDNSHCSYKNLIKDVLAYQNYVRLRGKEKDNGLASMITPFFVSGTYNLRTWMGTGMPTQIRKGEAWTTISEWTMSMNIGHYERWPQCPDLLRKSWKFVVEIPFVSWSTFLNSKSSLTKSYSIAHSKKYTFHFAGTFDIYGPELVCSVRNSIINLASRPDLLTVNVSLSESHSTINKDLLTATAQSDFCLITKGDSYSSSFFYHAIAMDCIPVVISDWFVFSLPWLIDYEKFVIRISESDFTKNPNYCLDYIKQKYDNHKRDTLRQHLLKYKSMFSYNKVLVENRAYLDLLKHNQHRTQVTKNDKVKSDSVSIIPLDAMLLEMRYNKIEYKYYNNVPCYRPYMCYHNRSYTEY